MWKTGRKRTSRSLSGADAMRSDAGRRRRAARERRELQLSPGRLASRSMSLPRCLRRIVWGLRSVVSTLLDTLRRFVAIIRLPHEKTARDLFVNVVTHHVPLGLRPSCDPVRAHKASEFLLAGLTHHLEQAELKEKAGIFPIAAAKSSHRRLVHAQSPADPYRRPTFLARPQNKTTFLGVHPPVPVLGAPHWRAIREPLVERGFGHKKLHHGPVRSVANYL